MRFSTFCSTVQCGVSPFVVEEIRKKNTRAYTALLQMWRDGMVDKLEWLDVGANFVVRTCSNPSFAYGNRYRVRAYKSDESKERKKRRRKTNAGTGEC